MSLDITEAFANDDNLIIEAGVGIGKSFAYLIPALLINEMFKKPIVIATSSIQLSEQIYDDVHKISQRLGFDDVRAVIGKGMGNYSCQERVEKLIESGSLIREDQNFVEMATKISSGEVKQRSDILYSVKEKDWSKVSVNNCTYEKCTYRNTCDFYKMRHLIKSNSWVVDFIVVNQDLLIRDLIRKYETGRGFITDNIELTVIDEAHNFEEKVRSALTLTFDLKYIKRSLRNTSKLLSSRGVYTHLRSIDALIFNVENIFEMIEAQIKNYGLSESERYVITPLDSTDFKALAEYTKELITSTSLIETGKKERQIDDSLHELRNFQTLFYILGGSDFDHLIWSQNSNKNTVEISYCPKNIKEVLTDRLFSGRNSVILTSATICQSGSSLEERYDYITKALGFKGVLGEQQFSPYNYTDNALMYVAKDMPLYRTKTEENKEAFLKAATDKIVQLCNFTKGRTLVLFSAKEDLRLVIENLSKIKVNWGIIVQKEGSSQDSALNEFKENKGVIFGTGIFWEGINISGQDLSQVIIVRLPFPVPSDPITEHKIKNSKDAMNEIFLPEMLIKLRQGTGRLIRSETDAGIISILDSRLSESSKRPYRDAVLSALPFKTYTEDIETVEKFAQDKIIPRIEENN
ncbi:ATP-dependent DNA helicase [Paenibacillus sp. OK003]|uniref:ATP-dependent DNA helicase n=1 Tax=Paenibacillus sp. OK003 TaxID=1884380 RepID=UPI0008D593AD|nr:ATP-dependent DNA helicase [Paenibacillus sp. OK003]SEK75665.1 ATP-dependent DNA helicase DinG [Paenibacillus sp. OK003]